MLSSADWEAAKLLLQELGIICCSKGVIWFNDCVRQKAHLVPGEMPTSLKIGDPPQYQGIQRIAKSTPRIVLVLSRHAGAADFTRLLEAAAGHLIACPVSGVEAFAGMPDGATGIPQTEQHTPQMNPWMHNFQSAQLPWLASNGITTLPCEPEWQGNLKVRLKEIEEVFEAALSSVRAGEAEPHQQIVAHVLHVYLAIYRSWGIIGQFGHMLGLNGVREKFSKLLIPPTIPLTLDSGHVYEQEILRNYCGADVSCIYLPGMADPSRAAQEAYMRLFTAELLAHRLLLPDLLNVPFAV